MSVFDGTGQTQSQFQKSLNKVFLFYGGGFAAFVIVLAVLEQMGMPKEYIGYAFLAATVLLYGGIGVISRTNDAADRAEAQTFAGRDSQGALLAHGPRQAANEVCCHQLVMH